MITFISLPYVNVAMYVRGDMIKFATYSLDTD